MTSIWHRVGEFLGLVEEPYHDDYGLPPDEQLPPSGQEPMRRERERLEPPPRVERSNVRTISPARSDSFDSPEPMRAVGSPKVHITTPTTFNDVEEVGVNFRNGIPTIMNL